MSQQDRPMDSAVLEPNATVTTPESSFDSELGQPVRRQLWSASKAYRTAVQLIGFALPWPLRRWLLCKLLGFSIHPTAQVGFSLIYADEVVIDKKARLGHLNYIGRLDRFVMGEESVIARYNWIPGLAKSVDTPFYKGRLNRRSDLILGRGALITTWHLIDCTDAVVFEDYASLAGARSQILTHGIDILRNRQACGRVHLGAYTIVATGSIVLKGVTIADRCIVGAGSTVINSVKESYSWVAGNPAVFVRKMPENSKLLHRTEPTVY